jgi:hypothetical protein
MDKSILNELQTWFMNDRGLYTDGILKEKIEQYERELNLVFSIEYKEFLKQYGSGIVDSFYIHGNPSNLFMGGKLRSVIDKTNFYKNEQKWPDIDDWYIISDDGSGNPIGCKPDGSVWLSDHDAGFEQVKLADNFEEFLHKLLTDTLYD